MIKQIAASALTPLTAFGFASAAFAHHIPQQPFIESESVALLNVVRATGHKVFLDAGPCLENKRVYGFATTDRRLVICTKAHGNDAAELADTIRHETLHLAQFCKARKHGATSALLAPGLIEHSRRVAIELHMPAKDYRPSEQGFEAEARAMAHVLEEEQVAAILINECGVK